MTLVVILSETGLVGKCNILSSINKTLSESHELTSDSLLDVIELFPTSRTTSAYLIRSLGLIIPTSCTPSITGKASWVTT